MAKAVDPKLAAQSVANWITVLVLGLVGYLLHKHTGFGDIDPGAEAAIATVVGSVVLPLVSFGFGYLKKADEWIRREALELGISGDQVDATESALKSDIVSVAENLRELCTDAPNVHPEPETPVYDETDELAEPVEEAPDVPVETEDAPDEEDPLKGVDAS